MVNVELIDLDEETLYEKILQAVEDICDEYALQKDFGILSMANQQVVDYLLETRTHFTINFNCEIRSDDIVFIYDSQESVFEFYPEYDIDNILNTFAYKIEYQNDYKHFTFKIHVKPKISISQKKSRKVNIHQSK